MVSAKKKILFYSILSSGHLNVCASVAKVLLDNFSNKVEVYFVVDNIWAEKLSKIDSRFKFGVFEYENKNNEKRMADIVDKLEQCLHMNLIDKLHTTWQMFIEDDSLLEVDEKSEELIRKISPDFMICDQGWHLPGMIKSKIPYAFIASCNPLIFSLDGFPQMGSDCRVDDKKGIEEFNNHFLPLRAKSRAMLYKFLEKRGGKKEDLNRDIDHVLSDHFSIYSYPAECDYYTEELKDKYKLWQIDTPLYPARIPKPFQMPKEFEALPGKIVYVSLGSLFSAYTHLIQRLVDILDKFPYKYIVSKGLNGEKLKFPSKKFIGENYIDQLGVLQVCDAMIAHGGNNTFGECFYFGTPSIILPVVADQINNGTRLEETGYGFTLDIMKYTEEELKDRLDKCLNDDKLKLKLSKASERIQRENRIEKVVGRIVEYVYKL